MTVQTERLQKVEIADIKGGELLLETLQVPAFLYYFIISTRRCAMSIYKNWHMWSILQVLQGGKNAKEVDIKISKQRGLQ